MALGRSHYLGFASLRVGFDQLVSEHILTTPPPRRISGIFLVVVVVVVVVVFFVEKKKRKKKSNQTRIGVDLVRIYRMNRRPSAAARSSAPAGF